MYTAKLVATTQSESIKALSLYICTYLIATQIVSVTGKNIELFETW